MNTHSPLSIENGFSLLEIMIAIVLLTVITFTVVSIQDNAQNTKERTLQFNEDNLAIESAMSRIEADFLQIYSPLFYSQKFMGSLDPNVNPGVEEVTSLYERHPRFRSPNQEGIPIPIAFSEPKEELIFLTTANRRKFENQPQSHFTWIRYSLTDIPVDTEVDNPRSGGKDNRPQKALVRQTYPDDPWAKKDIDWEDIKASTILAHVESLKWEFWNLGARRWESTLTAIVDGELLVRGLKLEIVWFDSQGNKRSTNRIFRNLWPLVVPQNPQGNQPAQPVNPNAPFQGLNPINTLPVN
jgi:prepilin-type N-terminal cleavage/methylation domain-containing protein